MQRPSSDVASGSESTCMYRARTTNSAPLVSISPDSAVSCLRLTALPDRGTVQAENWWRDDRRRPRPNDRKSTLG